MLTIFFVISILNLNVFTMITNSKIMKNSQGFTLMIRIFIDLSFLIMISIIKTIIIINNNNNHCKHKLLKNNNVRYLKFADLYKLLTKTQTNLLSRINLANKTQTSTDMTIKIRLNLIIMNFKGDLFLLEHINIISKIKKMSYR